jgi:hypothetical protein
MQRLARPAAEHCDMEAAMRSEAAGKRIRVIGRGASG